MAEEKRKGGEAALRLMNEHLSAHRFLVGDDFTIADIALYAYTHIAGQAGFDLDRRSSAALA